MHSRISRIRPAAATGLVVMLGLSLTAGVALAARAPKPPAAPIVTAKVSTGTLGDRLNLNVVIKTSGKVGLATAQAVVHFASGDRVATLPKVVKLKNGASVTGTVRVPADETPGSVVVDFTIVYAGKTYLRSVTAVIAPAPTPAPTPEPVVEPSVEPSVAPSVEPSVAPSVEPSVAPSVEPTVEATIAP